MSRKYKFHNKEGLYFVSFAVVYWIDVFTREEYVDLLTESLDYCSKNKGMEIYAWCIMPSYVHLIFQTKDNNPSVLLKELKTYTSKQNIPLPPSNGDFPHELVRRCKAFPTPFFFEGPYPQGELRITAHKQERTAQSIRQSQINFIPAAGRAAGVC
ncbi:transposase [Pontibacter chitinilyticus]|uniref:transposase n=1 Tax=Pontibacter chitinilyticus TaxID=2674989 RepID=UPI00321B3F65